MEHTTIEVRGAREHNLRSVDLVLPRNQLVVFTGVSGSGKSSLAFDTLYAEGQRRYLESLSSYARQFIGQLPKPNVDYIGGLSPAISISQKSTSSNPRSTVGTITEIHDFLRVLFARVGTGFCPTCQVPITSQTRDQIVAKIQELDGPDPYLIMAPVVRGQKGEYRDLFDSLRRQGYARVRVDTEVFLLSEAPHLNRHQRHDVEVVISKFVPGDATRTAIADAVNEALRLGENCLIIAPFRDSGTAEPEAGSRKKVRTAKRRESSEDLILSSQYACPKCSASFVPPTPQLLSFNSPQGMCPQCEGIGVQYTFAPELLIPDATRSIRRGAIELLGSWNDMGRWHRHQLLSVAEMIEKDLGLEPGVSLTQSWTELPEEVQQVWLRGTGSKYVAFTWRGGKNPVKYGGNFEGIIDQLLNQYRDAKSTTGRKKFEKYMETRHCDACDGTRMNIQARQIKLFAQHTSREDCPWINLQELCELPIPLCLDVLSSFRLSDTEWRIAAEAVREVSSRLQFLLNVGLDYLSLSRSAPSLSGGESQRIRLASQIGSGLVGVLYVLDEPSIGLHPRDNDRLIESLKNLRDQGNSLVVVEHDEDTIRAADMIVDFGPGPGVRGGEIVGVGSLSDLAAAKRSITGKFLSGAESIPFPATRRAGNGQALRVLGATHNNLKNIDVTFPLGKLICVTGVSGSGKSSLVGDILVPVLRRRLHAAEDVPGKHRAIEGIGALDKIIDIDQSPIGRTPRSNPATYVKVFDEIRTLYTELSEAKRRGYTPGRFSFNVSGGRCEACEGNGSTKLEMDFLSELWVTCSVCEGRRYNHETLQVLFKGKSIAEVLDMDVQQALQLFENVPRIAEKLRTLQEVGLDYIKLGQPSPTLSGGEAQRVKLAKELSRRETGRTLYLLDEPTTGLHFHDMRLLLKVLQDLVDRGNTVLVIEHNLDVIQAADWIIDIGPEGGEDGGEIVFEGTPEQLAACGQSHTGRSLSRHLSLPRVLANQSTSASKKKLAPKSTRLASTLHIEGASQHNLRDVALDIPHRAMTVFSGPSGSGKSSLAMDTIYAEGQRRYVESLSSYARQFVGQMPKPSVDRISGLAPAIAIEQKTVGHNPRSTVGTVTEIYDYLRVLMARLGTPHCPDCDIPVSTQTADQITETLFKCPDGTRLIIAAPIEWRPTLDPHELWNDLRTAGLVRVRVNGKTYSLDAPPRLSTMASYDLQIVIDRAVISPENRSRISESVELALSRGEGVLLTIEPDANLDEPLWKTTRHSQHLACRNCGWSMQPLTPHGFSFNTQLGWCPDCEGIGTQTGTNPALLVDSRRSLRDGAILVWPTATAGLGMSLLEKISSTLGLPMDIPLEKMTAAQRRVIFHGAGSRWIRVEQPKRSAIEFQWKGLFPALEQAAHLSPTLRATLDPFVAKVPCATCDGSRLNRQASAAKFRGLTMGDYTHMTLDTFCEHVKQWQLETREQEIAGELVREIQSRTEFLIDVGLEYLTLSRGANTLSGGESQRIRLASQLGSGLCGVLYVLDEPTIGLHPRDNARLLGALHKLRDLDNTLIVVEHDREIIQGSDQICDFGPGAGRNGGHLVAQGTPTKVAKAASSVTGPYLSGKLSVPVPAKRRTAPQGYVRLRGAKAHTLRNVDVDFPLGTLSVVTGPSGSGKSTLINDVLFPALHGRLARQSAVSGGTFRALEGADLVDKVIRVDQSPIGQNPSSTPATYSGVFELIRQLFSQLPQSRARGFTQRQFSFNVPGGRCEKCEGNGQIRIEMHFLADVWVPCDSCHGRRYTEDTLAVQYHGYSIHDVLEMPIGKALEVFGNVPKIRRILQTLADVGLDYVALGQPATTLSGGEAQRVKLAAELSRPDTGRTLYLLDEPTTGLHFSDVAKLLEVLQRLVDLGNTVIVIEHNLDVIKSADWAIDLGPEAGLGGGQVVAVGTPEEIVQHAIQARDSSDQAGKSKPSKLRSGKKIAADLEPKLRSYTGEALASVLASSQRVDRKPYDPRATLAVQAGDIELERIGSDVLLPWQSNGMMWHTRDSVDRKGDPVRWDRQILIRVVEAIESYGGFAPIAWEHGSIVEVTGPIKSRGWFLHAITAETWLLKLKFRVPRRSFIKSQLMAVVQLPTLNQMENLEVHSNQPRVKARAAGTWLELELQPHTLAEIDTPEFWQWLNKAMNEFLGKDSEASAHESDPEKTMPWKVLGQRWHALRKGFPPGRDIQWPAETLSVLVQTVHQTASEGDWRWDDRSVAKFTLPGRQEPWLTLHTKNPEGLILVLNGPALPGLSEWSNTLPMHLVTSDLRDGQQQLQLSFTQTQQPRNSAVRRLLQEHLAAISSL